MGASFQTGCCSRYSRLLPAEHNSVFQDAGEQMKVDEMFRVISWYLGMEHNCPAGALWLDVMKLKLQTGNRS